MRWKESRTTLSATSLNLNSMLECGGHGHVPGKRGDRCVAQRGSCRLLPLASFLGWRRGAVGRPSAAGQAIGVLPSPRPPGLVHPGPPARDAADLKNLAKIMYAGYGIRGIDRTMQPVYGDLFGDPETVLRAMIRGGVTNEPIAFTSPPQLLFGYFTLRFFESAGSRGLVAYRLGPGWQPDSYVMSWRTAVTTKNLWQTGGGRVAFAVAMSILCSVKVGSPDPIGKGRRESLCGGYNKQLGTEYAHSPTTGENVLVSPGTDWNEIGPQGPGYYRPKGGTDYEKLQPGRSDC